MFYVLNSTEIPTTRAIITDFIFCYVLRITLLFFFIIVCALLDADLLEVIVILLCYLGEK